MRVRLSVKLPAQGYTGHVPQAIGSHPKQGCSSSEYIVTMTGYLDKGRGIVIGKLGKYTRLRQNPSPLLHCAV